MKTTKCSDKFALVVIKVQIPCINSDMSPSYIKVERATYAAMEITVVIRI